MDVPSVDNQSVVFQFFDLLSANPLPTQYLANELTVFAPVDSAFNQTNYQGPRDENMILNHMGNFIICNISILWDNKYSLHTSISAFVQVKYLT